MCEMGGVLPKCMACAVEIEKNLRNASPISHRIEKAGNGGKGRGPRVFSDEVAFSCDRVW